MGRLLAFPGPLLLTSLDSLDSLDSLARLTRLTPLIRLSERSVLPPSLLGAEDVGCHPAILTSLNSLHSIDSLTRLTRPHADANPVAVSQSVVPSPNQGPMLPYTLSS